MPTDKNPNPTPAEVDLSGLDAAIGDAGDQSRPPEPPVHTDPPELGTVDPTPATDTGSAADIPGQSARKVDTKVDPATAPDPNGLDAAIAGETPPDPAKPAEAAPPVPVDPATLVPGTPEHAAAVEAKRVADEAAAAKTAAESPEAIAERERKAAVDKEADELGIKNQKTRDRFHALNAEVAAVKPFRDELEKAGIKDVDTLRATIEGAYAAVDMVGMVQETGADPQQYSFALEYLTLNNAADRGDEDAREQCFAWIESEYLRHAAALGREVPGKFDPLEKFPDLKADLEGERITRERALELAQQRTRAAVATERRTAAATATTQATDLETKIAAGRDELNAFGASLLSGPEREVYLALKPALVAALSEVTTKYPPDQWKLAAGFAWDKVKLEAQARARTAAPATPAAGTPAGIVGPTRSAGPQPVLQPDSFADPMAALEAGIDAADRGA
jgi:hypothetical protein